MNRVGVRRGSGHLLAASAQVRAMRAMCALRVLIPAPRRPTNFSTGLRATSAFDVTDY
eukprot:SAG31_NODE_510_length_14725_cov_2.829482_8_plen_58_part_00